MLPLLLLLVTGANALPSMIFGRPTRGGFLADVSLAVDACETGYVCTNSSYLIFDTVRQPNDHFENVHSGSWQQRYQYNYKFFNPQRPLAFLMIGGESVLNAKWVTNENITMMQWAAEFGAAAFQVEHRFYGPKNNTPFGDLTTASLQYLNIHQALADIDSFIGQMNSMYFSQYPNIKWITFGGSYPGTLSAFFRETYPIRTIGAVSTSSAVHFQTDYYGYAINTEATYRTVSASCADNIGKGFKQMIDLAYGGATGRATLQQKFNLCTSFDNSTASITKAVQYFFSNYYGLFQGINQYTGDNRDAATRAGLGVPGACQIMNNAALGDEMTRIKAVENWQNSFYNISATQCSDNSYDGFIKYMSDTSYPDSDLEQVSARSWTWQTCTSLGYFQTTDGNNGIFGSTVPLDFYADQCTVMFGSAYNLDNVFSQVDTYRSHFYDNYKGTKVVFPNGSYDPWKSLGFPVSRSNAANDIDAFTIEGTAHCANMYPPSPNDNQSLKDARVRIHNHLAVWITDAFSTTNSANSTTVASTTTTTTTTTVATTTQSSALLTLIPSLFTLFLMHSL